MESSDTDVFAYDQWPSGEPYDWGGAARNENSADNLDFHVDLGCGKLKKGRIGVDRFPAPGVNVLADFDALYHQDGEWVRGPVSTAWPGVPGGESQSQITAPILGLPFATSTIESVIAHHVLEHVGRGFPALLDDVWRVLRPEAPFRLIVPLFPSHTSIADPDHRRMFVEGSFEHLIGYDDEDFAVPYIKSKWEVGDKGMSPATPMHKMWTPEDRREMRVTLRAVK